MNIKIWDSQNKQWLRPMSICFDWEDKIWKITAIVPGADPLTNGWYDLQGDDLNKIAITGDISYNTELLPEQEKEKQQ